MSIQARPPLAATAVAVVAAATLVSGCGSVSNALSGDKIDYRTSGSQSVRLDVPPDLSQLPGQSRYGQATPSIVTATGLNRQTSAQAEAQASVAPSQLGSVRMQRQGQMRWLTVPQAPEDIYGKVKAFWSDSGFELVIDRPEAGLMETSWAENRVKVQEGGIRGLLGQAFETLYDTGERDQYRIRIERSAQGSEIYVSHRGLTEVYEDNRKERTTWRARPSDPNLEAEMLSRLMVRLGAPEAEAKLARDQAAATASAQAATPASLATLGADGTSLTLNGQPDLAWRRVGLALDRSGFTVEARDRQAGTYDVRIAVNDPSAPKPGFFSRLFGSSGSAESLARYRVSVTPRSTDAVVSVLGDNGQAANNVSGRLIAKRLSEELN